MTIESIVSLLPSKLDKSDLLYETKEAIANELQQLIDQICNRCLNVSFSMYVKDCKQLSFG